MPKIAEMMRNDVGHFFDEDLLGVFFQAVVSRRIPEAPAECSDDAAPVEEIEAEQVTSAAKLGFP